MQPGVWQGLAMNSSGKRLTKEIMAQLEYANKNIMEVGDHLNRAVWRPDEPGSEPFPVKPDNLGNIARTSEQALVEALRRIESLESYRLTMGGRRGGQ